MNPDTLIVGAVPSSDARDFRTSLIRAADFVVAADAGLEVCLDAGRLPDLCVGDFDSVHSSALESALEAGVVVERHPVEKDLTDLDLALDAVRARGLRGVAFTAVLGERLDHTLAALGTLMRAVDLGAVAIEPDVMVHPLDARIRPSLVLEAPVGATVSVLAATGSARVSLEGFRYPLLDTDVLPLSSLGVSNIATETVQRVTVSAGQVFVLVRS